MGEVGKKLRRLGFAAAFMLGASGASAQLQEFSTGQRNLACGSPSAIGDGWPTATPEDVGLDGPRLCGIAARLAATNANVHAVIVVRRGTLVFEQYFPGHDQPWGMGEGRHEFDATTKHDMRSVSKSAVSLLVGIAIDRELIKSTDEPVVKFFPDYSALKSPGWDNITLRHLLTMSSGIQWDENRAWKDPQGRTLSGDRDVKWIAAQGLGGQRIFIVPELDLVMVTTSGLYGSGRQGQAALDILASFIIPAVRDK